MYNYIAVKKRKLDKRILGQSNNTITHEMFGEVQAKCKSIPEEEISKYLPVVPVVAIRTSYTNKVLMFKGKSFVQYDTKLEVGCKLLYDLSLLSSKQFLLDAIKTEGGSISEKVLINSGAYPIGICYYDEKLYLLSHIVFDDSVLTMPEFQLNEGYEFVDITDLKTEDSLEIALNAKLVYIPPKPEEVV